MELNVLTLQKTYYQGEQLDRISVPFQIGVDESSLSDEVHPEMKMATSYENLSSISGSISGSDIMNNNKLPRRYQKHVVRSRRHSLESEEEKSIGSSIAESEADMQSSMSETDHSDSENYAEQTDSEIGVLESEEIDVGTGKLIWETHRVEIVREAGFGFGFAVSGGIDNPHFANGETSIAVSDVLKCGPAEGILKPKDRIISINDVSVEDCYHSAAISLLRESGDCAIITIRRRVYIPSPHTRQEKSITITKKKTKSKDKKDKDLGFELGCKFYVKSKSTKDLSTIDEQSIEEGDFIMKVNDQETTNLTLRQVMKLLSKSKGKLNLTVERPPKPIDTNTLKAFGSVENVHTVSSRLSSGYNSPIGPATRSRANSFAAIEEDTISTHSRYHTDLLNSKRFGSQSSLLQPAYERRPRSYSSPKMMYTKRPVQKAVNRSGSFTTRSCNNSPKSTAKRIKLKEQEEKLNKRMSLQFINSAFIEDEEDMYAIRRNSESALTKSGKKNGGRTDSAVWHTGKENTTPEASATKL